jgi:hypothetical protein
MKSVQLASHQKPGSGSGVNECNDFLVLIFLSVFSIQLVYVSLSVPAYYLNTDPYPGSQTNADPCGSESGSWSDLKVTKS